MHYPVQRVMPIVRAACLEYGATVGAVIGGRRDRETCNARHAAIVAIRRRLGWSARRIASAMGGLDHATVLYAIGKMERLERLDPHTQEVFHQLFTAI